MGIALCLAWPAQADISKLADLLYGPYLALNYFAMCALNDPGFQQRAVGVHGSMPVYAQRIKEEVIASLGSAEAQSVMVEAADAAKAKARSEIRALAAGGTIDPARVAAWCRSHAAPFILAVMEGYDRHHAEFERRLADAKK